MSSSQPTRTPTTNLSRKRSHAEITRSESRSTSAEPLYKRRRTLRTPLPSITPPAAVAPRYERDGLDFRRPAMSSANNVVDLTGDDDEDTYSDPAFDQFANDFLDDDPLDDDWLAQPQERAPSVIDQGNTQPAPPARSLQPTFIDLSSDDEPIRTLPQNAPPTRSLRRDSSSSEVVFVGERTATPPANPALNNPRPSLRDRRPTPGPRRDRRQPTIAEPPALPGMGTFASLVPNLLRRAGLFGDNPPPARPSTRMAHLGPIPAAALPIDEQLEIINFNYGQPAFPMGDRDSAPPQATPGEAYKEPEPVPEGFAGDIEEDGVYVCPMCEEELATGLSEEKQQVWVAKQCGHVYCGGCVRKRHVKGGTKKDRNAKADFKNCAVDGCTANVTSKGAMIQVYL